MVSSELTIKVYLPQGFSNGLVLPQTQPVLVQAYPLIEMPMHIGTVAIISTLAQSVPYNLLSCTDLLKVGGAGTSVVACCAIAQRGRLIMPDCWLPVGTPFRVQAAPKYVFTRPCFRQSRAGHTCP